MKKSIYLDYLSTTPMDERVQKAMVDSFDDFGNPSSNTHGYGSKALELIHEARAKTAQLIQAKTREIIFTSGATESNNLALKGVAYFYQRQGKHLITMTTEHKAVLDPCRYLESQGFDVTYLAPCPSGCLDLSKLEEAIRPDTILISVMHVNNETGVIQDIQKIAEITQRNHVLFHVDAAQSAARLPLNMSECPIDLMSFSAHKMYGPKGIGALFIRHQQKRVQLVPQIHGGGQERGLRSGTLSTHQIVGFGKACDILINELDQERARMQELHHIFWEKIKKPSIHINGDPIFIAPGCFNLTIDNIDAEVLLKSLNNLAFSTGSACSAFNITPSHVLLALGLSPERIQSTVRISFGRYTFQEDVQYAA